MINLPSKLVFPMIIFMTTVNILVWVTVHQYEDLSLFISSIASLYFHLDVALAVFLSLAYSRFRDPFAGVMGIVVFFIILELSSNPLIGSSVFSILDSPTPLSLNIPYAIIAGIIVGVSFNISSRSEKLLSGSVAMISSLILALLTGLGLREVAPIFDGFSMGGSFSLGPFTGFIQSVLNHPLLTMPYAHLHSDFIMFTKGTPLSSISVYNSVDYIMTLGFTTGVLFSASVVYAIRGNYSFAIAMAYMMITGLLTGINDAFEIILLVSAPLIYGLFIVFNFLFLFLSRLFDVQSTMVFSPDATHYIALRSIFTNESTLLILIVVGAVLGIMLHLSIYSFTKYRLLGTSTLNDY